MAALKEELHRKLQAARAALLSRLEDLGEYDLRRPMTPTGTNLLGLVKHLAGLEYGYLGESLGRPAPETMSWIEDGTQTSSANSSTEKPVQTTMSPSTHPLGGTTSPRFKRRQAPSRPRLARPNRATRRTDTLSQPGRGGQVKGHPPRSARLGHLALPRSEFLAGRSWGGRGGRCLRSAGEVGGVASEGPLVLLELVTVDALKGERDQYLDCLVAAAGAGEGQREECLDRCLARELVVGLPERGHSVGEAPQVAQGAAVLHQALPQVIAVQAFGECPLVGWRGVGFTAREIQRAGVGEQGVTVAGMVGEQVTEVGNCRLGCVRVGGCPSVLDGIGQIGHAAVPSGDPRSCGIHTFASRRTSATRDDTKSTTQPVVTGQAKTVRTGRRDRVGRNPRHRS